MIKIRRNLDLQLGNQTVEIKVRTMARKVKESKAQTHYCSPCCNSRVGRKNYCKECGEEFSRSEINKRFFEISKDEQVVITTDELDQLKNNTIEGKFVVDSVYKESDLPLVLTQKPNFVLPTEDEENKLSMIYKGLLLTNTVICGRYVNRGTEHLAVIRPFEKGLILQDLFWKEALKEQPDNWALVDGDMEVDKDEVPEGIVDFFEAMLGNFEWGDHEYQYYQDLKELVKKVRDRDIEEIETETETTTEAKSSKEFVAGLEQTAKEKEALKEKEAEAEAEG